MQRSIIFCLFLFLTLNAIGQKLSVTNLRCEYRIDPIGVDIRSPALSWELQSTQQNVLQTAYRIFVSEDSSSLAKDSRASWDSKKINGAGSVQVAYSGLSLQSVKKYFWKVTIWDNKGNSCTSAIASWQMGLLTAADWKDAHWIGYDVLPD